MSDSNKNEIIGAFVLGGLIGATLGILFAPASGKETRAKIGDWVEETKESAKAKIEKLEEEIKKRKEHLLKSGN